MTITSSFQRWAFVLMMGLVRYPYAGEIDPSFQILVSHHPYTSVEEAAIGEKAVDWTGTDITRMDACTESYAALELQYHLRRIVSSEENLHPAFEIQALSMRIPKKSIVLANVSNFLVRTIVEKYHLHEKLNREESFAILHDKERLYIIGHDRIGTLYGSYHLLESFGIRWFAPGDIGTIIPSAVSLKMPTEMILEEAKFITRGFWAWEDRGDKEFYQWMARNRLNFWTIAEPDFALLKKMGIKLTAGGHLHFDRYLNPNAEYPFNHPLFQGDEDKPDDIYAAPNLEYRGDINSDRKLSYFEAHPEWYGLVAGERETFTGDFGANICTSHADGVAELCRKLTDDLAKGEWKEVNTLNFWPLDVGKWCECEACQALGNFTDRTLLLIHQVYRAIADATSQGKIHRDIKVIFPIYYETLAPPSRPLPAEFDYEHCIGTVFPIQRCYVHCIDDTSCTEYNTRLWEQFLGWIHQEPRFYQGQYFMGEYYNVSSIRSLPVVYTRIMRHDIPLYYQSGVRHCHYMHVNTRLWGQKRLNNYLFAKLLWNPETNVDQLLDDYFKACYGNASNEMKRLYENLEFGLSNIKQLKHHQSLVNQINKGDSLLFKWQHLQFKAYHPAMNDGVDLEESVLALEACRTIMDGLLLREWDDRMKNVLYEDDVNLQYAENTIHFYYYLVQALMAKHAGQTDQTVQFFRLCVPFAEKLKNETDIVRSSSSHANAADGLDASLIERVYKQLGAELNIFKQ